MIIQVGNIFEIILSNSEFLHYTTLTIPLYSFSVCFTHQALCCASNVTADPHGESVIDILSVL